MRFRRSVVVGVSLVGDLHQIHHASVESGVSLDQFACRNPAAGFLCADDGSRDCFSWLDGHSDHRHVVSSRLPLAELADALFGVCQGGIVDEIELLRPGQEFAKNVLRRLAGFLMDDCRRATVASLDELIPLRNQRLDVIGVHRDRANGVNATVSAENPQDGRFACAAAAASRVGDGLHVVRNRCAERHEEPDDSPAHGAAGHFPRCQESTLECRVIGGKSAGEVVILGQSGHQRMIRRNGRGFLLDRLLQQRMAVR